MNNVEGILPLWKEKGMTSHDAVFKVRKILKMKKVGHSGTLDPDVEGVLPICIGGATKVVEYLMDSGKVYEGEVTLGISTTTEDASGEIVETKPIDGLISEALIDNAIQSLTGEIMQVPPMYSAIKVNGKRLYEYAREGKVIERASRKVSIYSYERTSQLKYDSSKKTVSFRFRAECGKGTYIRTLAVDTGKILGYPAHMSYLIRTNSGSFSSSDCMTLAELQKKVSTGEVESALYPLDRALLHFPYFDITTEQWEKVKNGALFPKEVFPLKKKGLFVLRYENKAVAIYQTHPLKQDLLKPVKILKIDTIK